MVKAICIICKRTVEIYPYRIKKFKTCSAKCRGIFSGFKKDYTPWNKGKFGKDATRWNGGRVKNFNGYIEIHNREHPFCNYKGYVLEHRLVMEKHLGRYLTPIEVVHHRNEIKDDNRLENLKLFANESKHRKFHNNHSSEIT